MISYPPGINSPEQKLMFCCARHQLGGGVCAEIRHLATGGLDWPHVLILARQHKLLGLLHLHLAGFDDDVVPVPIKTELRAEFKVQSQRNLLLTGEVLRLTRLMEAEGIFPLAYKGPVLSHLAYHDVAIRPCIDLDLLVRPQDMTVAERVLSANGYCKGRQFGQDSAENSRISNRARAGWLDLLDYEHSFVNSKKGFLVELHWDLAPRKCAFGQQTQEMWRRRVPCQLTASIATLCPEDLVLALSNHGNRHVWKRLEWLANFSEIVAQQSETLNWKRILAQARATGTRRMLFVALLLAQDLGKLSPDSLTLPAFVQQAIARDTATGALRDQVWRQIFVAVPHPNAGAETGFMRGVAVDAEEMPSLRRVIFMTRIRERARDRLLYITREFRANYFLWADAVLQEIYAKRVPKGMMPGFFLLRFFQDAVVYAAFLLKIPPKIESPEAPS